MLPPALWSGNKLPFWWWSWWTAGSCFTDYSLRVQLGPAPDNEDGRDGENGDNHAATTTTNNEHRRPLTLDPAQPHRCGARDSPRTREPYELGQGLAGRQQ